MKKLILIVVLAMTLSNLYAQEEGIFRINGGLAFGTKAGTESDLSDSKGSIGFNVGGEYLVSDNVGLSASYTQFEKSSVNFLGVSMDVWISSLDFDLRYYVSTETPVYIFAGLSAVKATAKAQGVKESESETGLNLGVGTIIPFSDKVGLNLQGKYHKLPEDDQFVFNAGIAIRLN